MARELSPTDLDAEEVAARKLAETRKANREQDKADFKWLMGQVQGRRFIWRLLELAGVYRSTFRADNEMAFLEGMRNMGLVLMADIHEVCPEKYFVMVKEHQSK
jgi:hypothetical protein